jgi:hypothetical protein
MPSIKRNVLRKIAEDQLGDCFHDLDAATRIELAISVVRQWITCEGNAVIVACDRHFWFRIRKMEDGQSHVVRDIEKGAFIDRMRRSRVMEEEIPHLLHDLNIRQCVRCYSAVGQLLQLRVDPAKRKFHIEVVRDEDA